MLHVISLGAGVQSSTLALMFADGELTPMPDAAIFADTGAEPKNVYTYLAWLERQLPFPVYRVMWKGGLLNNITESIDGKRFAGVPFFTESDGKREGQLRRQCTREFKVQPITKKLRELVGLAKGERAPKSTILVRQYIGISFDEAIRMKPARVKWIEHHYPLVDLEMRRLNCLEWMEKKAYPQPHRSACTFCPYHSDKEWRDLKNSPADFAQAMALDEMIRGGVRGTSQKLYLHRSLKPIAEIDFSTAEDYGQETLFGDECDGMCGV